MRAFNSYIYRKGTTPVTRIGMTTRSKIFSFASQQGSVLTQIGLIQSFNPSQSRGLEARRGIGFGDQIAELVPQNMDAVTVSVERVALYLANVMQVFGYNYGVDGIVRALNHHRWPFDVRHEIVVPEFVSNQAEGDGLDPAINSDDPLAIVTLYEACWMSSYSITYGVDDVIMTESAELTASDVFRPGFTYGETPDTGNAAGSGGPFSVRFS